MFDYIAIEIISRINRWNQKPGKGKINTRTISDVVTVLPKNNSGDGNRRVYSFSTKKLVLVWCFGHCVVSLKLLNYGSGWRRSNAVCSYFRSLFGWSFRFFTEYATHLVVEITNTRALDVVRQKEIHMLFGIVVGKAKPSTFVSTFPVVGKRISAESVELMVTSIVFFLKPNRW